MVVYIILFKASHSLARRAGLIKLGAWLTHYVGMRRLAEYIARTISNFLEPSPISRFEKPFSDEGQNLRKCAIPANTPKSTSLNCCQCMEGVECIQKKGELEWLASAPTDNEWLGAELLAVTICAWGSDDVMEKNISQTPCIRYMYYCFILCYIRELKPFMMLPLLVFVKLPTLKLSIWKKVD